MGEPLQGYSKLNEHKIIIIGTGVMILKTSNYDDITCTQNAHNLALKSLLAVHTTY